MHWSSLLPRAVRRRWGEAAGCCWPGARGSRECGREPLLVCGAGWVWRAPLRCPPRQGSDAARQRPLGPLRVSPVACLLGCGVAWRLEMAILGHSPPAPWQLWEGWGLPTFSRESWRTKQLEDLELARGGLGFHLLALGSSPRPAFPARARGAHLFPP